MALFVFATAATGTGIVAAGLGEERLPLGFFTVQNQHHLGRRPVASGQAGHELHRQVDVMEELLETGAEVIESRLAIWCGQEAVFVGELLPLEQHLLLKRNVHLCIWSLNG